VRARRVLPPPGEPSRELVEHGPPHGGERPDPVGDPGKVRLVPGPAGPGGGRGGARPLAVLVRHVAQRHHRPPFVAITGRPSSPGPAARAPGSWGRRPAGRSGRAPP